MVRQEAKNILMLPVDGVKKFMDKSFVFVKIAGQVRPERREVVSGGRPH